MKKIYHLPHNPLENLTLVGSFIAFLIFLARSFAGTDTIFGSYNFIFFSAVVVLASLVLLILFILSSRLFEVQTEVIISQKISERPIHELYFYIITSDSQKLEVSAEMFNAIQEGNRANISFNTINKKIESLEILE